MPLVLTENEETESGIMYKDRTGISYQFPKMYRGVIRPGERFVYYRGRKRFGGKRKPQYYFGTGVIGEVCMDEGQPDRFLCQILDYGPFETQVPFKTQQGGYLELGGIRRGYFQRGVRVITDGEYQRILESAELSQGQEGKGIGVEEKYLESIGPYYASPQTLRQVEKFAMDVAERWLRTRHPNADVQVLPRNNPGFDILVCGDNQRRYVEVKGTQRSTPVFFMTQGEIQFSREHAAEYLLLIVYRVGLKSGEYRIMCHEDQVSEDAFSLRPTQWACEASAGGRESETM